MERASSLPLLPARGRASRTPPPPKTTTKGGHHGYEYAVLLASRPTGWVTEENFKIVNTPVPKPGEGQILVRNHYLSLDPYMRGRMNDVKSYAAKQEIDQVMVGGTVGEVIESKNPKFKVGDIVAGPYGWQQYGCSDGSGVNKVDASRVPMSAYLGVVGMPGVTAWVGLARHLPAEGGRDRGGVRGFGRGRQRGGPDREAQGLPRRGHRRRQGKMRLRGEGIGLRCLRRLQGRPAERRPEGGPPDGIDCYFENVGGEILDAVLRRTNAFSRIAVCGLISQYNATEPYGVKTFQAILTTASRCRASSSATA